VSVAAKTITVQTNCGSTTGNVAYYAEGEPRLLKIREAFLSGKRGRDEVIGAVKKITGFERLNMDWAVVVADGKTFAEREQLWKDHIASNPALNRIYGNADIIAEFVMASGEGE
jgi:hypothetical protein